MKKLSALLLPLFLISVSASAHESGSGHHDHLPKTATDEPIPEKGYLVRPVKDNLYLVTEGVYQAMFLVTKEGVVVVDAPPSIGDKLLAAIKETTDKPVTHLIYTHSHSDHIGSASMFDASVKKIAHVLTKERLERVADSRRPLPDETFDSDKTLTIGEEKIELSYKGNSHEPGNSFVYFPRHKTLMLVDVVYPGWVPFTNLGMTEDVGGYIAAHQQIMQYDFEHFIGGHISRPGTRKDVETAIAYLRDLKKSAEEAHKEVDFMASAQKTGFTDKWKMVKGYQDAIADACTKKMLAKWDGKLGGAATNTPTHCWIMQEHLYINGQKDF